MAPNWDASFFSHFTPMVRNGRLVRTEEGLLMFIRKSDGKYVGFRKDQINMEAVESYVQRGTATRSVDDQTLQFGLESKQSLKQGDRAFVAAGMVSHGTLQSHQGSLLLPQSQPHTPTSPSGVSVLARCNDQTSQQEVEGFAQLQLSLQDMAGVKSFISDLDLGQHHQTGSHQRQTQHQQLSPSSDRELQSFAELVSSTLGQEGPDDAMQVDFATTPTQDHMNDQPRGQSPPPQDVRISLSPLGQHGFQLNLDQTPPPSSQSSLGPPAKPGAMGLHSQAQPQFTQQLPRQQQAHQALAPIQTLLSSLRQKNSKQQTQPLFPHSPHPVVPSDLHQQFTIQGGGHLQKRSDDKDIEDFFKSVNFDLDNSQESQGDQDLMLSLNTDKARGKSELQDQHSLPSRLLLQQSQSPHVRSEQVGQIMVSAANTSKAYLDTQKSKSVPSSQTNLLGSNSIFMSNSGTVKASTEADKGSYSLGSVSSSQKLFEVVTTPAFTTSSINFIGTSSSDSSSLLAGRTTSLSAPFSSEFGPAVLSPHLCGSSPGFASSNSTSGSSYAITNSIATPSFVISNANPSLNFTISNSTTVPSFTNSNSSMGPGFAKSKLAASHNPVVPRSASVLGLASGNSEMFTVGPSLALSNSVGAPTLALTNSQKVGVDRQVTSSTTLISAAPSSTTTTTTSDSTASTDPGGALGDQIWMNQKTPQARLIDKKATQALIQLVRRPLTRAQLASPHIMKKDVWNEIGLEMKKLGFVFRNAGEKCFQKWRNMERTFKDYELSQKVPSLKHKQQPDFYVELSALLKDKRDYKSLLTEEEEHKVRIMEEYVERISTDTDGGPQIFSSRQDTRDKAASAARPSGIVPMDTTSLSPTTTVAPLAASITTRAPVSTLVTLLEAPALMTDSCSGTTGSKASALPVASSQKPCTTIAANTTTATMPSVKTSADVASSSSAESISTPPSSSSSLSSTEAACHKSCESLTQEVKNLKAVVETQNKEIQRLSSVLTSVQTLLTEQRCDSEASRAESSRRFTDLKALIGQNQREKMKFMFDFLKAIKPARQPKRIKSQLNPGAHGGS